MNGVAAGTGSTAAVVFAAGEEDCPGSEPCVAKTSVAMARTGIDKIPTRLPGIRIIRGLLFYLSFTGLIAFKHAFRS
jgi:hypothetical protein